MKNNLICASNDIKELSQETIDYIFVTQFNDDSVTDFYKKFLKLHSDPKIKVIPIIISSYGGQVYSLLSMLDLIATSNKPVSTIALGKAMSCGAVLLAAGTKGYRYAAPSADIMIHEVSNMEFGKNTDIQNSSRQTKKLNNLIMYFLSKKSGNKNKNFYINKLKDKSNVDWYLSAEECKKLNLVDYVSVPHLIKE